MKIAFYMTGGFGKVLRNCPEYLENIECFALCPNWQSYHDVSGVSNIRENVYVYDGFNETFDAVDVGAFCREFNDINLNEVALVDKAHFKKKSGDYHLRYICALGVHFADFFKKHKPDYVFFPIIETNDAMMAYRMAQHFGVRPIVNSHSRFTGLSFFSESHKELLPRYLEQVKSQPEDTCWARNFLKSYNEDPKSFDGIPQQNLDEIYDFKVRTSALERFVLNLKLKFGSEKHNRINSLWIKLQVHFQRYFLFFRRLSFQAIEKFYLNPEGDLPEEFDFFPIHFSPESSINVPAPYYIDQTRVVDKILLENRGNRTLIVKEHPAMFGFRPFLFYKIVKHSPLVKFVRRQMPSQNIIRKANTVYSVTGTACLEAFLLGVDWVQFGDNFLSDWVRVRKSKGLSVSPEEFIADVRKVSRDFILYSPGRGELYDKILFSKDNVRKMSEHIIFHINQDRAFHTIEKS